MNEHEFLHLLQDEPMLEEMKVSRLDGDYVYSIIIEGRIYEVLISMFSLDQQTAEYTRGLFIRRIGQENL